MDKALALLKEIGIEKRNGDDFLTDADGNKIEFVLNTNTGNGVREKTAILIAADLNKLGFNVIFQPIEFNTLISKLDNTYDYDCVLLSFSPDTSADPADSMNIIKSGGYSHEWFPRQKTPSTAWEARMDQLMDAQMQTLDMAERKKDFDEVQEILAEQVPMILHRDADLLRRDPLGRRQRARVGVELLPRDVEFAGALFQEIARHRQMQNSTFIGSNKLLVCDA